MAHDWMRAAMEEDDAAPSTDRRFERGCATAFGFRTSAHIVYRHINYLLKAIIRRHSNREPPGLPIFKQRRNNVARLLSASARQPTSSTIIRTRDPSDPRRAASLKRR
jgi:hypothetical protein